MGLCRAIDCITIFLLQVKDLAAVSLNKPVRVFVNENTDVALGLRQEFIRVRANREGDREAIVAGNSPVICIHCSPTYWGGRG